MWKARGRQPPSAPWLSFEAVRDESSDATLRFCSARRSGVDRQDCPRSRLMVITRSLQGNDPMNSRPHDGQGASERDRGKRCGEDDGGGGCPLVHDRPHQDLRHDAGGPRRGASRRCPSPDLSWKRPGSPASVQSMPKQKQCEHLSIGPRDPAAFQPRLQLRRARINRTPTVLDAQRSWSAAASWLIPWI